MTAAKLKSYKALLDDLAVRTRDTAAGLEEAARSGVGGDAGGGLSNTPMHLGDLGSEAYTQELNATLLENETFIRDEVDAALGRVAAGTYGTCEACGKEVIPERLEALPYTRFCTPCAATEQTGPAVNINAGRPRNWDGPGFNQGEDRHAAGTPGGGSAVGGLAGTNVSEGSPANADLDAAMGSSEFDAGVEADDDEAGGYAGPAGGAVGGSPANKRARGGRTGRGLSPQSDPTDKPTGQ